MKQKHKKQVMRSERQRRLGEQRETREKPEENEDAGRKGGSKRGLGRRTRKFLSINPAR